MQSFLKILDHHTIEGEKTEGTKENMQRIKYQEINDRALESVRLN